MVHKNGRQRIILPSVFFECEPNEIQHSFLLLYGIGPSHFPEIRKKRILSVLEEEKIGLSNILPMMKYGLWDVVS